MHLIPHRPRFMLDQDAARMFLAEALLRWKQQNITGGPLSEPGPYGDGWTLQPRWDLTKLFRDDLSHVENLIAAAVSEGVIICPPGLTLNLIIIAGDYGDWMYDWRVRFDDARIQFSVCLPRWHDYERLGCSDLHGDPKGTGARNAWRVLNEAVSEANLILDGYIRAHGRLAPRRRVLRAALRFRA